MNKNINNMEEKHYTPLFLINKMWDILQEENIQAEEWLENVIIKKTGSFRIIEEKDIEKFSGFLLFKKSDFDEENFKLWLDFIELNKINFKYLSKPFPNFDITKKLKEL